MKHRALTDRGMDYLASHLVGGCADEHTRWLLQFMPKDAVVADMGCGVGAFAACAAMQRQDISVIQVNSDAAQAADCPVQPVLVESFYATSIETASCDCVLFQYAMVHANLHAAMLEAKRILKTGGLLLVYEPFGAVANWSELLPGSVLHSEQELVRVATLVGFAKDVTVCPKSDPSLCENTLRSLGEADIFDATFAKIAAKLKIFRNEETEIERLLQTHERVALSLSGGKDSLACLMMLRHWLDKITVYWCNTGDAFPETVAFMEDIRASVPNFAEVAGRQPEVIAADGWPSDVVPQAYTSDGNMVHGATPFKVQTRINCCYRSLMLPTYEAMINDGVTCIIRGKRSEEEDRTGFKTGDLTPHNQALVFPLFDWTESEVLAYLEALGVPLPKFYTHGRHSIDCMHCTAFWGDGHAKYLKAEHPAMFDEYRRRVILIKQAIADQMAACEV